MGESCTIQSGRGVGPSQPLLTASLVSDIRLSQRINPVGWDAVGNTYYLFDGQSFLSIVTLESSDELNLRVRLYDRQPPLGPTSSSSTSFAAPETESSAQSKSEGQRCAQAKGQKGPAGTQVQVEQEQTCSQR